MQTMTEALFHEPAEMMKRRGCDPWLADQLTRFRYKAGWVGSLGFVVPKDAAFIAGCHGLVIDFMVKDTYHPDRTVMVRSTRTVQPWDIEGRDEYRFAHWVLQWLIETEIHETKEWFRRDGEIFDNPHKPKPIPMMRVDELKL